MTIIWKLWRVLKDLLGMRLTTTKGKPMDAKFIASALIKVHEGIKLTIYADSVNNPTIGYGRDLRTRGISIAEANNLLDDDISYFSDKLWVLPWYERLDPIRQAAMIDMAFNLGLQGLLGFVDMIDALSHGDWKLAAERCLASEWAKQVKGRATDIAHILATGELPNE